MNKIVYSLFFVALIIYSCDSTDSKETSEDNKEEDARKSELIQCDSLLDKTRRLEKMVVTEFYLIKLGAAEQKTSDSKDKQKLIALQKAIPSLIADIEKSSLRQFDSYVQELSGHYDAFNDKIEEVKSLLNSFESYENPESVFTASVLVEESGELEQAFNEIKFDCENLSMQIELKLEQNR